jgi:hypothetical protein
MTSKSIVEDRTFTKTNQNGGGDGLLRVFIMNKPSQSPQLQDGGSGTAVAAKAASEFERLMDGRLLPGSLGRKVQLHGGWVISVDWLMLGESDCFAMFSTMTAPTPDYLLLLSRRDPECDQRQVNWFADRILAPGGFTAPRETLADIRFCPHPSLVIAASLQETNVHGVLRPAERAFAEAFLRILDK